MAALFSSAGSVTATLHYRDCSPRSHHAVWLCLDGGFLPLPSGQSRACSSIVPEYTNSMMIKPCKPETSPGECLFRSRAGSFPAPRCGFCARAEMGVPHESSGQGFMTCEYHVGDRLLQRLRRCQQFRVRWSGSTSALNKGVALEEHLTSSLVRRETFLNIWVRRD
ncbi:hypothetical protein LZ31DRAFT_560493, partial [Colletotrichum somersetense]